MLAATDARTENVNSLNFETEVFLINLNILNQNSAGNLTATVSATTNSSVMGTTITGTPMTAANIYYSAWQGITTDPHRVAEMNKVISYYQNLGYTINRQSNDGQSLYWIISW
jgi:hypothetical protein